MVLFMVNLLRSRWAAIGAAVAVTLGGGGLIGVSAADTSSTLVPIAPVRVLDTRASDMVGDINDGTSITVQITGPIATVSEGTKTVVPSGASAITGNMTLVSTTSNDYGGFATIYPCGTRPDASNINFTSGQTVANSVAVPLSASGTVCIYVYGTAHVLLDVAGYYTNSEISDLAERVTAIEAVAPVSASEPLDGVECGEAQLLVRVDNEWTCNAMYGWEHVRAGNGETFVSRGGQVTIDGVIYIYFSGLSFAAIVTGAPGVYGSVFYESSDCSGTGFMNTVDSSPTLDPDIAFEGSTFVSGPYFDEVRGRVGFKQDDTMWLWRLEETNTITVEEVNSWRNASYDCNSDLASLGGYFSGAVAYELVWIEESPTNQFPPPYTKIS